MRRRKRRNRTGIYLVMLVAALFVGTLAVHGYSLRANCQKLATEQQNLKDKKKSLKKEQEQIKEQKEYRKTDQYVEDVAREKFGLVYDNSLYALFILRVFRERQGGTDFERQETKNIF